MSKKFYLILFIICLWIAISYSAVSAQISVEVLIYTGKISVTSQNEVSTTYAIPQEVTELPTNTILECIDGVAIFKIGEVQVVLEASDKLQLSSVGETEKFSMICISGEIEAMWGEDFFKLDQGQTLGLNSEGIPIIDQADGVNAPLFDTRNEQSSPAIIPPDPDEAIYTSTHL
jgi:hypothetical protein